MFEQTGPRFDILIFIIILLLCFAWIGVFSWFSIEHDRFPLGAGEVLDWLLGWGHG